MFFMQNKGRAQKFTNVLQIRSRTETGRASSAAHSLRCLKSSESSFISALSTRRPASISGRRCAVFSIERILRQRSIFAWLSLTDISLALGDSYLTKNE